MGSETLVNGHDADGLALAGSQQQQQQQQATNGVAVAMGPLEGKWIVQKFGGTSLGKFAVNVAEDIVKPGLRENRIAVVCSARSSHSKVEGTTNRLLRAAREAERANSIQCQAIVDGICAEHVAAAKQYMTSSDVLESVAAAIRAECKDLAAFLEATQRVGEISPRSEDKIIGKGEKLSCLLVAALLQDRGIDTHAVDLSDIIDFDVQHGIDAEFYRNLATALGREVRACGSKVPVITGYFGNVPGGLLDKIGRGYTDLCAALVAVGIGADELQVWKEVDGIFTADPRKVPTARLLPTITPAEAAELTFYGSEVIHPFTMEQVIRARIPIRIKNVMNPRGPGTVILPEREDDKAEEEKPQGIVWSSKEDRVGHRRRKSTMNGGRGQQRPKRPTAVTIKRQILVINVHSNKRSLSHGFFAKIFSTLDKWRLSVDLISTSEVHVSMALHSASAQIGRGGRAGGAAEAEALHLLDDDLNGAIEELRLYGTVDLIPSMAILSLVGKQMKNMIGIAGRMFSTLGENNVNIEMISQGASEINISCVIEERDADRALNILHTNLFTFLD